MMQIGVGLGGLGGLRGWGRWEGDEGEEAGSRKQNHAWGQCSCSVVVRHLYYRLSISDVMYRYGFGFQLYSTNYAKLRLGGDVCFIKPDHLCFKGQELWKGVCFRIGGYTWECRYALLSEP